MKTRIGVIGLADRGSGMLGILLGMEDIDIKFICDLNAERLEKAEKVCHEKGNTSVIATTDAEDLFASDEIEAVMIFTSWNAHVPLAIEAMRHGKYAAFEVGPAQNIGQVYDLVKTYEETKVPCMPLENCCYGERELMMKLMIQKGVFGELIHVRGGYMHDLRYLANALQTGHERSFHNLYRTGDLYLTHELGPIITWLNINRGNRILNLSSMSTKSLGITEKYASLYPEKPLKFAMGDLTTTMLTCSGGETILLTHNVSNPRPYSRGGQVQGTRGIWMEDKDAIFVEEHREDGKEEWEPVSAFSEYTHPLWKKKEELEGFGHGGMDYLVLRAFLEAVRKRTQTPIDVYDSATMLAVSALSETSVSQGGALQHVPDFTSGRWVVREPMPKSIYSLDEIHEDLFEGETLTL